MAKPWNTSPHESRDLVEQPDKQGAKGATVAQRCFECSPGARGKNEEKRKKKHAVESPWRRKLPEKVMNEL